MIVLKQFKKVKQFLSDDESIFIDGIYSFFQNLSIKMLLFKLHKNRTENGLIVATEQN